MQIEEAKDLYVIQKNAAMQREKEEAERILQNIFVQIPTKITLLLPSFVYLIHSGSIRGKVYIKLCNLGYKNEDSAIFCQQ